jgi:phosphotransferase system enzyme I (PtsI)
VTADSTTQPREVILKGIGVSGGVQIGKVFLLTAPSDEVVERSITEDEIDREIGRFEEALVKTKLQIREIQQRAGNVVGRDHATIFDAHLMVVEDRSFMDEVVRNLKSLRKNVEVVLKIVAEKYAEALAQLEDDYLRERAADVRDVTRRILRNLTGQSTTRLADLTEPCILIAHDLPPSDAASLSAQKVLGLATDVGSPTSHTAIMARALGITAVVGLHDVSVRVSPEDTVLIDGDKGILVIHPSAERIERYQRIRDFRAAIRQQLSELRALPAVTREGYELMLSANIEQPADVASALEHGAQGIGLFRTEYLYLHDSTLPSEEQQYMAYEEVARRAAPHVTIIRTLDLGGDKFLSHMKTPDELNPFMGWRAIRFCLNQHELFKTQLRAILRASVHENVKLMYPMVSNVDEVIQANKLLEECKDELQKRGVPFNENIEVGVMIEVPSAALTADLIAPYVSFFSLGTNDLVQYTMAVDRVNERVAYLYEPTHPAIVKLIKNTVDVAHENGIWVGICGEVAGNPTIVPLLIGLGVDEFSMTPGAIPFVKHVIRNLRYADAERLAQRALHCDTGAAVLALCREWAEHTVPEILELVT